MWLPFDASKVRGVSWLCDKPVGQSNLYRCLLEKSREAVIVFFGGEALFRCVNPMAARLPGCECPGGLMGSDVIRGCLEG